MLLNAAIEKREQGALHDSPPGAVARCEPVVVHLLSVGSCQGRHINEMRQLVEPSLGLALRSFHYLPEFR